MRGMFKEVKVSSGDLVLNNTPKNCLKNITYKVKNGATLSEENLHHVGAADIAAMKIEKLDLMQWALLKANKKNISLLAPFFDTRKYDMKSA
jgi:hypothetical protein